MPHLLPGQVVEIYTGDLGQILSTIQAAIVNKPSYDLTAVTLISAPGQVPGPGLACLCVWTK